MKTNIFKYSLLCLAFLFIGVSCVEEDEFNNEVFFKLERGGFVRFADAFNPLIGTNDATNFTYSAEIEDVNNNLTSYTVSIVDEANGDTVQIGEYTDFPATLQITSADIATALGVNSSTFEFAQTFDFVGNATRSDGVVFTPEPLEADFEEGIVSGNTQQQLYTAGYRNALAFTLQIACPSPPDAANYGGTYDFVSNGWLGTSDGTVQVVSGPGDNQITLLSAQTRRGASGDIDFIINLNEDQTVTAAAQGGYNHPTYGATTLQGGNGYTFECADNMIIITLTQTVAAGSFGPATTILRKQ